MSVPLRASISLQGDFTLSRHSSLTIWSQQMCSCSRPSIKMDRPMLQREFGIFHVNFATQFVTGSLAHMLDSLVRVTRRDGASSVHRIARRPLKCRRASRTQFRSKSEPPVLICAPTFHSASSFAIHCATSGQPVSECSQQVTRRTASLLQNSERVTDSSLPISYITLFSEQFSFLRSTSLLSVSRLYLALEGRLLPFELRYQTTLLFIDFPTALLANTGLQPSLASSLKEFSAFQAGSLSFLRAQFGAWGLRFSP
eukprot:TRINITY_DN984_c0_g1_i7.p2 TRINITY_DN984_c0_g1~~TRINITY_DN984_c0_g1_i7.p2  ORF type:complete len:256 (+),score=-43.30 TRINITY_DN984_c0_g1_i7:727-1494(+)